MEVVDKCDDPNAIHRWNRFKRQAIKKPNYYQNHFSLTKEKRKFLETALDMSLFKTKEFCCLFHRPQNIIKKKKY